jgi:hypothetical protein
MLQSRIHEVTFERLIMGVRKRPQRNRLSAGQVSATREQPRLESNALKSGRNVVPNAAKVLQRGFVVSSTGSAALYPVLRSGQGAAA